MKYNAFVFSVYDSDRMQYAGSGKRANRCLIISMPQPEFGKHRSRWVTDASD